MLLLALQSDQMIKLIADKKKINNYVKMHYVILKLEWLYLDQKMDLVKRKVT